MLELNDEERRRLEVQRSLILSDSDKPQLGRLAKNLSVPQRHAVGKLLLALVAADGVVTPDELRVVRTCYSKLGFEKAEIEAALNSLKPAAETGDDLVMVQPATTGAAGEAIPPASRAKEPAGLKLDRAAIAAIMQDTREVAEMLASAMASEDDAERQPGEARPAAVASSPAPAPAPLIEPTLAAAVVGSTIMTTTDSTLPARYAAFYQMLIGREQWQLDEAEAAARRHGHMLSGAIEALNDWAFEKYGGQLFVEDGERLVVEKRYLS